MSGSGIVLLDNAAVLDVVAGALLPGTHQIVVRGGKIASIAPAGTAMAVEGAQAIDCRGLVVMPGLCDAHVHCTACTADLPGLLSLPESLVAARAARVLEGMLLRGFTTIRDAGALVQPAARTAQRLPVCLCGM